jgi:hypothetical protein
MAEAVKNELEAKVLLDCLIQYIRVNRDVGTEKG